MMASKGPRAAVPASLPLNGATLARRAVAARASSWLSGWTASQGCLRVMAAENASAAPRLNAHAIASCFCGACQAVGNCQPASAISVFGRPVCRFAGCGSSTRASGAECRASPPRRAAGNPARASSVSRGFDQRLLPVGQGGHGRAGRRLALFARQPRLIDHETSRPRSTRRHARSRSGARARCPASRRL